MLCALHHMEKQMYENNNTKAKKDKMDVYYSKMHRKCVKW